MAGRTIQKRKKTFRDNAPMLVGSLFDDFISDEDTLLEHPRKIDALHQMRISGKPLRYVMEVCVPLYGRPFSAVLDEVKLLLEELGHVHDCDVLILKLRDHLLQIRMLNRVVERPVDRLRLKELNTVLEAVRTDRAQHYRRACTCLRRWKRTGLRRRLAASMSPRTRPARATFRPMKG